MTWEKRKSTDQKEMDGCSFRVPTGRRGNAFNSLRVVASLPTTRQHKQHNKVGRCNITSTLKVKVTVVKADKLLLIQTKGHKQLISNFNSVGV